jgi:cobalamin-dependent methionine synthase I
MKLIYDISELIPYINWPYFFFAWQVKEPSEKDRLQQEANILLQHLEGKYHAYGLFELYEAYSDRDDIVVIRGEKLEVRGKRIPQTQKIPCLRQQQGNPPYLCLSDFLPPLNNSLTSHLSPLTSKLGFFATSVDIGLETDFDADPYQKMMVQLLADRLAEAAAERMHEQVRKEFWGYAKDEQLSIPEMLVEKFQGIRPAVGYPSLPDTSLNFVLDDLLDMKQIGIRLTESGAMKPHASVSGLMLAHPEARYFSIGKIGEDQLRDYAHRRGLPLELCRRFLAANL